MSSWAKCFVQLSIWSTISRTQLGTFYFTELLVLMVLQDEKQIW
jgi:hypothetical protein